MAEKYDKNGYNSSDFKRNSMQDLKVENDQEQQDGEDGSNLNKKAGEYMRDLLGEKIKMNMSKFPICSKLIDQEVAMVQSSGRIPQRDSKYVDVYADKPVKVAVRVLVPVKEHPKFNFVGKLLGPKGNTMKHLQEETMCKMAVLGRGSMRDRQKEEELRNSLDPKYAHLSDELHVEVSALAPPAEAHARIAYALAEVKKYLIPDSNDIIRQSQMREIIDRGGPPHPRGPGHAPPRMGGPPRMSAPPPHMTRQMPPKTKVISILDRARTAMESSYSYEDSYGAQQEPQNRGGPRGAPEPDFYYERDRYYDDDSYYKEEQQQPREFKTSARDVGTRRTHAPRHYAPRADPYVRPPK